MTIEYKKGDKLYWINKIWTSDDWVLNKITIEKVTDKMVYTDKDGPKYTSRLKKSDIGKIVFTSKQIAIQYQQMINEKKLKSLKNSVAIQEETNKLFHKWMNAQIGESNDN